MSRRRRDLKDKSKTGQDGIQDKKKTERMRQDNFKSEIHTCLVGLPFTVKDKKFKPIFAVLKSCQVCLHLMFICIKCPKFS